MPPTGLDSKYGGRQYLLTKSGEMQVTLSVVSTGMQDFYLDCSIKYCGLS